MNPRPDAAVLALVDIRVGEGGARVDRYAIPFIRGADGSWREAAEGDGAWRALGAAIAEGRTIAGLTKAASSRLRPPSA